MTFGFAMLICFLVGCLFTKCGGTSTISAAHVARLDQRIMKEMLDKRIAEMKEGKACAATMDGAVRSDGTSSSKVVDTNENMPAMEG